MKTFQFDVDMLGKMRLEVVASSEENAKEMINDLLENTCIKDLRINEIDNPNMEIQKCDFKNRIKEIYKDLER